MSGSTARVSPTAHYTAAVWARAGLSPRSFYTPEGRLLVAAMRPVHWLGRYAADGATLDTLLLDRHAAIDQRLERAIDADVTTVIEIAAGLSGRGLRFAERFPNVTYIEADLPGMAARKRRMVRAEGGGPRHRVVALDALLPDGPYSLAGVAQDSEGPVAVITEGLLNYLPTEAVTAIWERIASLLRARGGVYLADLHIDKDTRRYRASEVLLGAIGVFARGRLHLHFDDAAGVRDALRAAGLDATVAPAAAEGAGRLVQIIEARAS